MADAKSGIFISHTGADAELANAVGELVHKVYSGAITAWYSSDQSPQGGIAPGGDWSGEVHAQLKNAARVFALVTPRSLTRPWIYWESGIGSVLCPGRVAPVVFRVDLGLPQPLGRFNGFDGLNRESVASNLGKVGADAGLSPDPGWLGACVDAFVTKAEQLVKDLEAEPEEEGANPVALLYGPLQNIAERLDRIEKEIVREPGRTMPRPQVRSGLKLTMDDVRRAIGGDEAAVQLVIESVASGYHSIKSLQEYVEKRAEALGASKMDVANLMFRLNNPDLPAIPDDDGESEDTPGPWEDS